ncbi:hypothetical protein [Streptoalloteichus hindustanus]|uniref:Excreted virulence factor EspC, type VII ESX diderm n=1 Tax=Streptoalloteichus hindustanus TaxID=2017 RepID=A0A1M4U4F2_STRHI|nr:hypothetical protein [Streptoalloteichus hindustanus]SHE51602.1 hypothetical protein SAMN05444320_101296 [Streptoalloteichus hindustanus]
MSGFEMSPEHLGRAIGDIDSAVARLEEAQRTLDGAKGDPSAFGVSDEGAALGGKWNTVVEARQREVAEEIAALRDLQVGLDDALREYEAAERENRAAADAVSGGAR